MINNAGTFVNPGPIAEGATAPFLKSFDISFKGVYLMLHYFLPLMVETAKHENTVVNVVNTVSIGIHLIQPGTSAYQLSRLAVARMCEFVMTEYGDKGVNCIALAPGAVLTSMSRGTFVEPCKDHLKLHFDIADGGLSLQRYS
jgi:NAD(P)-dependent dehydrogenase (short-subunit alcohol dehydrogenase family)